MYDSILEAAFNAPHIILPTGTGEDTTTILANCTVIPYGCIMPGEALERVPAVYIRELRTDGGECWEGVCFDASTEDMATVEDYEDRCHYSPDDFTGDQEIIDSVAFEGND